MPSAASPFEQEGLEVGCPVGSPVGELVGVNVGAAFRKGQI